MTLLLFLGSGLAWSQGTDPPTPPPPAPSKTSQLGEEVTNPVTGEVTVVTGLIVDPAGTPTEGETAFVQTADGYAFLVKIVGEIIYNRDDPPLAFLIVSEDPEANTVEVDADPPGCVPPEAPEGATCEPTATLETGLLDDDLQAMFFGEEEEGIITPDDILTGAEGVRIVRTGRGGRGGRDGALFVPPSSGGPGSTGPTINYTTVGDILTATRHGVEVASIGGRGGNGGDSYLSFWSGRDGGDGGGGGSVTVSNASGIQVATTGPEKHGIYALSRSGAAGNGGSGWAAPGGGTGGHSSDGGSVRVTNDGTIVTTGAGAFGIYGLSVSGNGGRGGDTWGLVGRSGSGGYGGSGGPVTIINNGMIQTGGELAHGILAQSIGGSGGSSGTSGNLLVSLNGAPDNGGNGGSVEVTNSGSIVTTGAQSRGIFAQSIGGGGGSGGGAWGLVALGGSGSNGGSAGTVGVTNAAGGVIRTEAVQSDAIFAQSVGGSGGSGADAGGLIAVGGGGDRAGNGGAVTVENFGTIRTFGDTSRGIVAQSIGGGGGDGGSSGGMVSVGGSGGGGGASATVTVTNGGSIRTGDENGGDDAPAIFAQSVGGGGGNGGSAGSIGIFAGVAVGGSGAGGGNGGDVIVTLQGRDANTASVISTQGDRSTGVFAQSVGGGGGNGGGAVQVSAGFGAAASVAVGGNGAGGGAGGTVSLSPGEGGTSVIQTEGDDATGVFLQSVGGGGGNGGYAIAVAVSAGPVAGSLSVGIGGDGGRAGAGGVVSVGLFDDEGNLVSPGFEGSILTRGERSTGFFAQSVGGGGGNGGLAVSVPVSASGGFSGSIGIGVGGKGGAGGAGGTVTVGTAGNITTEQAHATGMLVQSVGGGGGNGGGSITAALAASGGGAGTISVGVGGDGAGGGDGGRVTAATLPGQVRTAGENATGILVQSVGGGGGNGGYSIAAGLAGAGTAAGAINVGLGGDGGGGGDAGTVRADLQSAVTTAGESSSGILVQSVGGGGGNGGFSIAAGGAGAGTGAGTVSVGLGGDGGTAGNGGAVTASSSGAITTGGNRSGGFIVQSIGGGGGNGGFNVSGSLSGGGTGSGAVSVGLGGGGGGGGVAGAVKASTSADVVTGGDMSTGILAQSVGGGGGNGGFNVSVALSGAGTGSGAVGVGLGGTGGEGSNGSTVGLTVDNDVTTGGRDSAAVIAQSVGGGGGNGGFNVSVAGSGAGTGSGSVGVGLGGSGEGGGDSAAVMSSVTGNLTTAGDDSLGLLVQSVGGGGGNGGLNVVAAISAAGTGSGGAAVGLGGGGGDGGNAGSPDSELIVDSTLTGNVTTQGNRSVGIVAQALGGGGGSGGVNVSGTISLAGTGSGAASVGLGGAGGGGGHAFGTVSNTVTGSVATSGDGSGGILAQSVGGGGGNGGLNVSGTISAGGTGSGAVSVGIGGAGGGGGNSGKVDNSVTGDVITSGDDAFGVLAQSVGGGGGNGGTNVSGAISLAKTGAGAIGVGIGGAGGGGGLADDVENTVSGIVLTAGLRSGGVITQSLGGGGGNGGLNLSGTLTAAKSGSGGLAVGVGGFGGGGNNGADATSTVTGGVITAGDESPAILTQSLGGGGGNGGLNVSGAVNLSKESGGALGVGIGGFGGGGGNAGAVKSTVTTTSEYVLIRTNGDASPAIVAQSIGGGGGSGGLNVTGVVSITGKSGAAIGVGVGGFGGGAGDGGTVSLEATGDIVTEGNDSHALFAQSLGGGGGNGGVNVSAALNINKEKTGGSASIGVGGFGGDGGNSGDVDVTYGGTIFAVPTETEGPGSHGIVAQSLAGGGGNGGVNVSAGLAFASSKNDGDGHALVVGVGGFGGGGGNAGAVDVSVLEGSRITSSGDDRSAILAQSIGGGGGNGGVNVSAGITSDAPIVFGMGGFGGAAGTAGTVDVTATADLFATGDNARGIFAQSVGGGGGNGGLNVSGAISFGKETTPPSVTFGLGGFGGAGNVSDDVTVNQAGNIATAGGEAHGIFAQSLGGGGGNGGMNVSTALILADDDDSGGFKDLSIVAGIGGHGGTGADAGDALVSSTGDITTSGDYARGIFAQSIGGGGGNGGINFSGNVAKKSSIFTMGVGGFGSGGGDAGSATVNRGSADAAAGKITTAGTGAIGIESTSIGGGGGDAGVNIVAAVLLNENDGGDTGGTDGGDGGDEEPKQRPHPQHTGVDPEVFVNYDKVLDELEGRNKKDKEDEKTPESSEDSAFAVQLAVGGAGGGAGQGGTSTVNNHGDIETLETFSHGILAQSIGGGGGNAAYNVSLTYIKADSKNKGLNLALGGATGDGGSGAAVAVEHDGVIETHGADSHGIIAQSVGGGGGNAAANLEFSKAEVGKIGISIGRRGGTGGEGGDVGLASSGAVVTHGDRSWGLLAQSIGNGGGNSTATTVSLDLPADEDKKQPARGGSISVGLEGGVGGGAGSVEVTAAGLVATEGELAHAIFAQSVGGGGGNGGDAEAKSANASIAIGGSGGTGGTGGTVDVTSSAEVRTFGAGSIGIIAQSVGGGGGTGGKSGASIEGSEVGVAISLGGSGGTGSASGAVTVENSGLVATIGADGHGILAQSLGGGGGNANMSVTSLKGTEKKSDASSNQDGDQGSQEAPNLAPQVGIAIGGSGGTGAAAGAVVVRNTGTVSTEADGAVGIFAQSIGGGGGNASQTINKFSGPGANINFGLGGSGGVGGTGGDVTVENLRDDDGNVGRIVTTGARAHGIVAMSIGGGGGTGGTTISQSENEGSDVSDFAEPPKTFAYSVNIGGAGGEGGTSGLVTVTNDAEIVTAGQGAHGVFAQSIGGGGGNGGISYSESAGLDTVNTDVERNISIGGAGGSGNVSGDVIVTNTGSIEVFGDEAYGVFAQSVGGGGGNGGFAGAAGPPDTSGLLGIDPTQIPDPTVRNFAVGGAGGEGADSGDVLVDHFGSIVAHGDDAYGIYAQSIAGGGGTMGASYASPAGSAFEFIAPLIIGSRDGGTGEAGRVTVNTEGSILMLGDNSQSHNVQSVNGGGGNLNLDFDVSQARIEQGVVDPRSDDPQDVLTTVLNLLIEIGSVAVEDGVGAAIQSEHVGDLVALGANSIGSSTQSIGGGGGSGQMDLTVNDETEVDLDLVFGGTDSVNSGGGNVDLTRVGDVGTAGDSSTGTLVQTIGGGGGTVNLVLTTVDAAATSAAGKPRFALSAAGKPVSLAAGEPGVMAVPIKGIRPPAETATAAAVAPEAAATLAMGANGSIDNSGGNVRLTYSGDTATEGALSAGLQVQSIGGGGGDVKLTGLDGVDVTLGGRNGASGAGGDIALANSGDVVTSGALSHGVVLQSIGGGGGMVLTDLAASAVEVSLSADNTGSGGDIEFTQSGDVAVVGEGSIALLAQSIGGGGGIVDRVFMGSAGGAGTSGSITLSVGGNVGASGAGGVGVFAQSAASEGQGDIEITVETGGSVVGPVDGAAVWLSGGAENRLTNYGTVTTTEGVLSTSVRAESGDDAIDNHGVLAGSIDLGAGENRIDNRPDAVFAPGAVVELGSADNLVQSDGILAPGAMGRAQRVDMNGSYVQSSIASAYSEIDFATDEIDQLFATGTVDLDGSLYVSLLNTAKIPVGRYSRILFQGRSGLTDNGLVMETAPSVVISYELGYYNDTTAALAYEIDFEPDGMSDNLNAIGEYINRGQMAGGGDAAYGEVITKLVYDPDMAAYRNSLSQLSPEFYGEHQVQFINSSTDFGQRLMSCKQTGGRYRFTREGSCVWLQYDALTLDRDAYGDYKTLSGDTSRLSAGAQTTLDNDWSFGFGVSKEDSTSEGFDDQWSSRGTSNYLGLSAKRRTGPGKLSGVLSYGWNETDSVRRGTLLEPFTATVRRDMSALATTLRYSYDFEFDTWYLRPMVDAGWMHLNLDSASEQGAGAIDLQFVDRSEDHVWLRPAVEVGREFAVGLDYTLRLNLNMGAQKFVSGDETLVKTWLEGGRSDVPPISLPMRLGNPLYGARVGMEIFSRNDFLAQITYTGAWYDNSDTDTMMFRFQVPLP